MERGIFNIDDAPDEQINKLTEFLIKNNGVQQEKAEFEMQLL